MVLEVYCWIEIAVLGRLRGLIAVLNLAHTRSLHSQATLRLSSLFVLTA